jgi:quinol-cytochrome oxidoreductase complex cytochrome b subunit/cytochrome c551/c552
MKTHIQQTIHWLELRTGLQSAVRSFLLEDIPASAGWPQVFGSVALFLFLTQALTGILLAFNFAGTANEAYGSLTYIIRNITLGRMIHGLHHWGASMMWIVVIIHMTQVFLFGAYKKPRETTWISGVILLLLLVGFELTGYLLPWDNRAYWGSVVTVSIMGQTPLVGPYLQHILGASNGVGVVTFARFYSLHVLVLPATMCFLIGLHLYLVRRHGVAPAPFDDKPKKKFYPEQVFRDMVAVFVAFVLLFVAANLLEVPLEGLADPTNATYVPRPEWYFLFLFQSLKFFQGSLEPIGSVGLPTLAVLALFCVPFVDRGRLQKIRQRTIAIATVVLAFSAWTALTAAALHTSGAGVTAPSSTAGSEETIQVSAEEAAGMAYFRKERCEACHNLVEGDPKSGPTLAGMEHHRPPEWMTEHFKHSTQRSPTVMETNALLTFVQKLTPENAEQLTEATPRIVDGAQVYVENLCGSCHQVNGSGGEIGPSLNGLATRRSRVWVEKHFASPKALSPGSTMPSYHFSSSQENAIINYLFALP